jgi:Ser/Thr protein kinase RdoA (MazF antagonist)
MSLPELRRVGRLIRRLHDAAEGSLAPLDAQWDVVIPPDRCHHDLAPWNLVCGPDRRVFIDWGVVGRHRRVALGATVRRGPRRSLGPGR